MNAAVSTATPKPRRPAALFEATTATTAITATAYQMMAS
jgi:hypothetical protein